jgi:hypothetical protein
MIDKLVAMRHRFFLWMVFGFLNPYLIVDRTHVGRFEVPKLTNTCIWVLGYFSLISGSVCSLWLLFHPYMIFGKPTSHHLRYDHCPIHMSCRDNMSCSFTTRRWTQWTIFKSQ